MPLAFPVCCVGLLREGVDEALDIFSNTKENTMSCQVFHNVNHHIVNHKVINRIVLLGVLA